MQQVLEAQAANTATRQYQLEMQYGVRYSELLRLPYFDIVEYHVVDPMHNLLLGTGEHIMKIWKDKGLIKGEQFDLIQECVDRMDVPPSVGRIPYKIASNFSFTADQWKNWICIFLYCLHGLLPMEYYFCWVLFIDACCLILKLSITLQELEKADEKLLGFCKAFEVLYGKENCTSNMHMNLHLKASILKYGPVCILVLSFRFNGILGSFKTGSPLNCKCSD